LGGERLGDWDGDQGSGVRGRESGRLGDGDGDRVSEFRVEKEWIDGGLG